MINHNTLRKHFIRVVSVAMALALLPAGLPATLSKVSAAADDPLPHAPLPAYVYGYAKPAITLDTTSGATDMTTWMNTKVLPLLKDWYPVIADNVIDGAHNLACLPVVGVTCPVNYTFPSSFIIKSDAAYTGVAYTTFVNGKYNIVFNPAWVRANQASSYGVFIHEMTHVVQQYKTSPTWFTEGVADYIRYFVYKDATVGYNPNRTYLNGYGDAASFINYINNLKPHYVSMVSYQTFTGKYTRTSTTTLTGTSLEQHWLNYSGHSLTTWRNLKPGNATTRCIDLPNFATANGTRPDIWDCVAQDNERWVAMDQGATPGGVIQGVTGGKCLRVNTAVPTTAGYAVDYTDCNMSAPEQKFWLRPDKTVKNESSNRCLRPVNNGTTNGTKLEVVGCNATITSQQWTWSSAL